MKRSLYTLLAGIMLSFTCLILSCQKGSNTSSTNTTQTQPANSTLPTITSLSTTTGGYYTGVTITGTNFSATAANNQVLFNGVAATVITATATQLTVSVPLAAGTGPVTVTVNSVKATGPVFTYQKTLAVTTVVGYGLPSNLMTGAGGATIGFNTSFACIAADTAGNLYFSLPVQYLICKQTPNGTITPYIGTYANNAAFNGTFAPISIISYMPQYMAFDASKNLYGTLGFTNIWQISNKGIFTNTFGGVFTPVSTSFGASFETIGGMATDAAGDVYVSDFYNNVIRKITPGGIASIFAGSGKQGTADGAAALATFYQPANITIDANGNLYVIDFGNNLIRKITPAGTVSTLPVTTAQPTGITVDNSNNIFIAEQGYIKQITPAGQETIFAGVGASSAIFDGPVSIARFYATGDITTDHHNNIYVLDENGNSIRKVGYQ